MSHPHAEAWDLYHQVRGSLHIPYNRPCDRCGELVAEGFIHPSCLGPELRMIRREATINLAKNQGANLNYAGTKKAG